MDSATTDLLARLVAIPSVNPMGRDVVGPPYFESRVTAFLEDQFAAWGLPTERLPVEPERENLLARLDGDPGPEAGGALVIWEAHQDVVPVEGMTIPPFTPAIRDGRLYGRGACDVKGTLAAMAAALRRLQAEPRAGRPTIVLVCSVNEEHGFTGAKAVSAAWRAGRSRLLPRDPDAVIVAEPTDLDVLVAHKGVVRWRCRTVGRAAHSSRPQLGVNAIYRMAKVLDRLEAYAREVAPTRGAHPLLGSPTLSVGRIVGGLSVNTVPDSCAIEIDRRLLPGEDPVAARQHVIEFVAAATEGIEHEPAWIESPGLPDRANRPLAALVGSVARSLGARGEAVGAPFGTNAPAYFPYAPTVVFGPGSIDQAHTADEWIDLEQLALGTESFAALGRLPHAAWRFAANEPPA